MKNASSEPDHYATLGVSPSANSGEIRDAFVTLIRKHRDQPGETKVEVVERARQINIAYDKLSNPSQRRAYDESRGIFFAPPAGRAPPTAAGNDDDVVEDEARVAPVVPVRRSDEADRAAESRAAAAERAAAERAAAEKRDAEKRDAGRSLPIGAGLAGAGIAGAGMAGAGAAGANSAGARSDQATAADDGMESASGQREEVAHDDHVGESRYADEQVANGRRSPWGKVSLVAGGLVAAGALAMLLPGLGSTPDAVSDAEVARSDAAAVAGGTAVAGGGDDTLVGPEPDQVAMAVAPGVAVPVEGASTGPDTNPGAYYPSGTTAPSRVAVTNGDALPNRSSTAEAQTRTPAAVPAEREATAAPAEVAVATANAPDAPAEAPAASAPAPERAERVAARSAVPMIGTYAKWVSGELAEKDNPRGRLKGTVNVRFTVERNGRTTDCRPVGGSANAALGSITCQLIEQRVKFTPALDSAGQPISSELRTSHTWGRRSRR